MKAEKSHMQGRIFLDFFFPCLLLPDQSKRKLKEKIHCARETKQNEQACNFLEQNKLLGTAKRKKNPLFNINLQFLILNSLTGYKKINLFLNKASRKKKLSERYHYTSRKSHLPGLRGMFLDGLKINLLQPSATLASL